jgi:hypothetical protein
MHCSSALYSSSRAEVISVVQLVRRGMLGEVSGCGRCDLLSLCGVRGPDFLQDKVPDMFLFSTPIPTQ